MKMPVNPTEALARAHQHWNTRPEHDQESRSTAFTIALSREAGTFGAAVAREVGNRLGWPVYDRELLQRIADDIGVHQSLLESVDERQESWLSECVTKLFALPEVNQTVFLRRLVETLLSLASHGNCVIVGRGATKILPLATTLRVRVMAPLELRIEAIHREDHISLKEAAERVEATDRERQRFLTTHFHFDPADATNYDLVLNAARFTTGECADLIIDALARLREHPPAKLSPLPALSLSTGT